MIHGDPCFIHMELTDPARDEVVAVACARSAYHLFANYLSFRPSDLHCGPLFMWWDEPWYQAPGPVFDAIVETMIRTLDLAHPACLRAALYRLNHVVGDPNGIDRDHPRAVPAIDAFIARQVETLSDDALAFAPHRRAGDVA